MKRARVRLQSLKTNKSVSEKSPGSDSKSKTKKPKDELVKKQNHVWKESELIALIAAIEARPLLWAQKFRNCDQLGKIKAWNEIFLEFNHITPRELKMKWKYILKNLRYSYKKEGVSNSKWPKYLPFLVKDKQNWAKSGKSGEVEVSDYSELDNYQSKRPPFIQGTLALGNVSSSSLCVPTTNTSGAALQMPDPISTFCEYLLAELNMLSDAESRELRKLLMQLVYNFENTFEAPPTRRSNYY